MITKNAKREVDIHAFLTDIKRCSGKVYLETLNGDKFNLHSVFSRYILAAVIKNGKLPEGATYTFDETNLEVLAPYLD